MAYQDTTSPAQVMIREIAATRRFFERVGAGFARFVQALSENSSLQRRVDLVHALQNKSDEELARLNIKRDNIVNYVFRDLYYI